MKRTQIFILLVPAVLAILLSIASYYYSWKFHALYLAQDQTYEQVEQQIRSSKNLSSNDMEFFISNSKSNHRHTQDQADYLWAFGNLLAGLAFVITVSVIKVLMQLEVKAKSIP
jgi:hypothetical protein